MAKSVTTDIPVLKVEGTWESLLTGYAKPEFERLLPDVLRQRRWFGGKARNITSAQITEAVPVPHDDAISYLALVTLAYDDGIETYVLALSHAVGERAAHLLQYESSGVLLGLQSTDGDGVLYDGCETVDWSGTAGSHRPRRGLPPGAPSSMESTPVSSMTYEVPHTSEARAAGESVLNKATAPSSLATG